MTFKPVDPQVNFPQLEKKLLKHWYQTGIVEKYLHKNHTSKKHFSFMDGPITANNPMGVHHAWGRTYKDLWQRFWNMRGYRQRFQNGFDCQGLWVEVEVEKELGLKSKKDIENLVPGDKKASIAKFIELCKQRVRKYAVIQTKQSQRLGYFADWDHSYFTMAESNNYMIWHFLKRCYQKGYLYKGVDSVPWCPRCGTAISQHEMLTEDYKEIAHESVFFKVPIGIQSQNWKKNTSLLVWTTTPWTIPANAAMAIHPDFKYGLWRNLATKEKIIFVIKNDQGKAPQHLGGTIENFVFANISDKYQLIKELSGKELIGITYQAPFDHLPSVQAAGQNAKSNFHKVVNGQDLVTAEEGTGILHVAPGAGQEDFQLGKEQDIPIIEVIDEEANYLDGFGDFTGKNAKEHPDLILNFLKTHENGKYWFKKQKYSHRYPACWRCKVELVWRVVDEWYIAMDRKDPEDKQGRTLRKQMIDVAKQIKWLPEFGLKRELDWLNNMHDWLISKKRYWGLALPIWECSHCGNFEVIGSQKELKTKAVKGWNKFSGHTPHRPYIDEIKIKCKCGQLMDRIPDVGNPWLDAGIVSYSTITPEAKKHNLTNINAKNIKIDHGSPLYLTDKKKWQQWFPADFITESFPGQFKNWFYSMIAMSTVLENQPPYKLVLGFGTLLAEDGRPMHKSWGNAIEFNQGADELGVDVMRFMYALHNPADNLLFGPKGAALVKRKFHLLLWNVYRFFVTYANIDKFKPETQNFVPKGHNTLDQWIIFRLLQLIKVSTRSFENYDAAAASQNLLEFVSDLSTWYVRRSRNRLGPTAENEIDKLACYQTLYYVLSTLSKLLAPINPFLADEIYTNLTQKESVHIADWPKLTAEQKKINTTLLENMKKTRWIVERGHAARKEAGLNVRQPLLKVKVKVAWELPFPFQKLIKEELNVKEVYWDNSEEPESFDISLDTKVTPQLKAEGQAREIIRQIQIARKEADCELTEYVIVTLPDWPKEFETEIKNQTLVKKLIKGNKLQIKRLK